jgi:peptidyl-prolyl cis-trans isomerase-like 4
MANTKAHENGSQFYITLRDEVEHLDGKHTIFGVVSEGLEILDKINNCMLDERNAPYQNIRIWRTEVIDDPFPDPEGLEKIIPPKSPRRIEDDTFKKVENERDEADLQERMAKVLAKSQSTTLEILHDLPDADIAPPDSDLFIANMNPATQDGDLELIFSRFGPIKSCDVVRDWKTGDSLQYAFITFENQRECEEAYFKMHDAVIDDRRIVVNFSQSVAKLWNKHRVGARISKDDIKDADMTKGKGRGKGSKGKGRGKAANNAAPLLAASEGPRASRDSARHNPAPEDARRRPAPEDARRRSRSYDRRRHRG